MPRRQGDGRANLRRGTVRWARGRQYSGWHPRGAGISHTQSGYGYDPTTCAIGTLQRGTRTQEPHRKGRSLREVRSLRKSGRRSGTVTILTIGPDGRFMEWDSRSRMAPPTARAEHGRSTGPPNRMTLHDYVWNAIRSRAVTPDAGVKALQGLAAGTTYICTVGTGNAFDGYFESVRQHSSTGPRR